MTTPTVVPTKFNLKLVVSRETWGDFFMTDNLIVLGSIVRTAREVLDNAGEFIIEGDRTIPTETSVYKSRAELDREVGQLNAARGSLGKPPIAWSSTLAGLDARRRSAAADPPGRSLRRQAGGVAQSLDAAPLRRAKGLRAFAPVEGAFWQDGATRSEREVAWLGRSR